MPLLWAGCVVAWPEQVQAQCATTRITRSECGQLKCRFSAGKWPFWLWAININLTRCCCQRLCRCWRHHWRRLLTSRQPVKQLPQLVMDMVRAGRGPHLAQETLHCRFMISHDFERAKRFGQKALTIASTIFSLLVSQFLWAVADHLGKRELLLFGSQLSGDLMDFTSPHSRDEMCCKCNCHKNRKTIYEQALEIDCLALQLQPFCTADKRAGILRKKGMLKRVRYDQKTKATSRPHI